MTNKKTAWWGKSAAVLFTSVVAPVFVNLVVRSTPEAVNSPSVPAVAFSPVARPAQTVRILASGLGRTPDAALQDAVHTALRQALASLVGAETWARYDSTLCASVLHDMDGLLLGWKDLGVRKEWRARGPVYHREAAVEVNLTALADRLHVCHTPRWNEPISATSGQFSYPLPQSQ